MIVETPRRAWSFLFWAALGCGSSDSQTEASEREGSKERSEVSATVSAQDAESQTVDGATGGEGAEESAEPSVTGAELTTESESAEASEASDDPLEDRTC